MLGADVRPVPAVPFENPKNYNHQAREYAKSVNNAIWTNQFDNIANAQAHYISTGPEIWEQTNGDLDGFVCATGTGGTLAGVGKYLKEKSQARTQIWLADPPGSVLASYITSGGKLTERSGSSITEGVFSVPGHGYLLKIFARHWPRPHHGQSWNIYKRLIWRFYRFRCQIYCNGL